MQFQVTEIEFDLDPGDDSIPQKQMDQLQQELTEETIGQIWEADDADDLVDEITNASGWCINSIDYRIILK